MNDDLLEACEQCIEYKFKNAFWIRKALTHSSNKGDGRPSNERLEFLGDAVLGMVISEYLFNRLKGRTEGELTKIKSRVVSRATLSKQSRRIGFDKYMSVGKGMLDSQKLPMSVMANVIEAIIGAIYLDGGLEPVQKFILESLATEIEEAILNQDRGNFKSLLQQYSQRELNHTPTYEVLKDIGPDHDKSFHVVVIIGDQHYESAWGPSKKEAEQRAAELTYLALTQTSADATM